MRTIIFSLIIPFLLLSTLAANADSTIPITKPSQDGYYSYKIVINEKTNAAYVTHPNSNYVSVINTTTNSIIETIQTDRTPVEIVVNPSTNFVYVGNGGSGTVSIIDGTTNDIVETLKVTNHTDFYAIGGIAVNQRTNKVYVLTNEMPSQHIQQPHASITVIDGTTNKIEQTFKVADWVDYDVSDNARGLAVNSRTGTIYVSMAFGSIYVFDGLDNNKLVTSLSIAQGGNGEMPTYIAVNENTNTVYVSRFGTPFISIMNGSTNREIGSIEVGSDPQQMAIDEVHNTIYVSTGEDVSVVNGSSLTVERHVKVGEFPIGIAFNPINKSAYVANWHSNFISIISTQPDHSVLHDYSSNLVYQEFPGNSTESFSVKILSNADKVILHQDVLEKKMRFDIEGPRRSQEGNITLNGFFEITIPHAYLGGKYTMLVNNRTLTHVDMTYNKAEAGDQKGDSTTIAFNYDGSATKSIDILGTTAIPELPEINGIAVIASIIVVYMAVIIVPTISSTKTRLSSC